MYKLFCVEKRFCDAIYIPLVREFMYLINDYLDNTKL